MHIFCAKTMSSQVFFYLFAGQIPYELPLDFWKKDDELDEVSKTERCTRRHCTVFDFSQKVSEAIESVLVVRMPPTDWNRFDKRAEAINRRREKMFGTPYDPAKKVG